MLFLDVIPSEYGFVAVRNGERSEYSKELCAVELWQIAETKAHLK